MGYCVGPDENKEEISFEIRRESVVIRGGDHVHAYPDITGYSSDSAEISKEYLKKLIKVATSPEWKEQMLE